MSVSLSPHSVRACGYYPPSSFLLAEPRLDADNAPPGQPAAPYEPVTLILLLVISRFRPGHQAISGQWDMKGNLLGLASRKFFVCLQKRYASFQKERNISCSGVMLGTVVAILWLRELARGAGWPAEGGRAERWRGPGSSMRLSC